MTRAADQDDGMTLLEAWAIMIRRAPADRYGEAMVVVRDQATASAVNATIRGFDHIAAEDVGMEVVLKVLERVNRDTPEDREAFVSSFVSDGQVGAYILTAAGNLWNDTASRESREHGRVPDFFEPAVEPEVETNAARAEARQELDELRALAEASLEEVLEITLPTITRRPARESNRVDWEQMLSLMLREKRLPELVAERDPALKGTDPDHPDHKRMRATLDERYNKARKRGEKAIRQAVDEGRLDPEHGLRLLQFVEGLKRRRVRSRDDIRLEGPTEP